MAGVETVRGYVTFDPEEYKRSLDFFTEHEDALTVGSFDEFIENEPHKSAPKAVQLASYLGAMSANRLRLARKNSVANPDDL